MIENVVGINDIPDRLRHLFAVFIHDVTEADAISIGNAIGHQRRNSVQAIKPASCLIDGFTNIVGGEMLLKRLLVFKRIVPLCVGHGARIEPAVDDFRDPSVGAAIFRMRKDNLVDGRSMEISLRERGATQGFEFCERADTNVVTVTVSPKG